MLAPVTWHLREQRLRLRANTPYSFFPFCREDGASQEKGEARLHHRILRLAPRVDDAHRQKVENLLLFFPLAHGAARAQICSDRARRDLHPVRSDAAQVPDDVVTENPLVVWCDVIVHQQRISPGLRSRCVARHVLLEGKGELFLKERKHADALALELDSVICRMTQNPQKDSDCALNAMQFSLSARCTAPQPTFAAGLDGGCSFIRAAARRCFWWSWYVESSRPNACEMNLIMSLRSLFVRSPAPVSNCATLPSRLVISSYRRQLANLGIFVNRLR
mmetsp:Transcript_1962/g.7199  ORF Transcript_1962/g.7199 Transcript_1962/m.7199 type:complete len:277 (-) Transcript_1962:717-1547(-)